MNPQVTHYIEMAPTDQKDIMAFIRALIYESVEGVQEEFKWGRPVFRLSKDFAYLKTAKNYVTLGFFDFEKIDDPKGLLEGTGKDMRHIKLKKLAEVDHAMLAEWFRKVSEGL